MKKSTLQLVLKYRWFCLIHAGVKTSEYRKLTTYWKKRLLKVDGTPRGFDVVRFRWGYEKDAPEMTVDCLGIEIDAKRKRFDIKLGHVWYSKKNCKDIGEPTSKDLLAHKRML